MEKTEGGLKHLRSVRLLAVNAVLVVTNLYTYTKENSGSLKSTFGNVEKAVTTVIGPVYQKTKEIPEELLQFIDKKVDDFAPPLAKKAITGVDQLVHASVEAGVHFVQEAKLGPQHVIDLATSSIKSCAAGVLDVVGYTVNRYPVLRKGTDIILPTVSHVSETYNSLVTKLAGKGYPIFGYFPQIPIDDITKAFKPVEISQAKDGAGTVSSETN